MPEGEPSTAVAGRPASAAKPSRWPRRLAGVVVLLALLPLANGCLHRLQDRLMFAPDYAPPPFGSDRFPVPITEFTREIGGGGAAVAWFAPHPQASAQRPAPVVIYFHGNAEIIDQQDDVVRGYHALGLSVLLPEYRGYGRVGGRPTQRAIGEDVAAFYDQLVGRADVDARRIVFHGRSLGGGPAGDLASRHKPAALILESAFASATDMARGYGLPAWLVKNPFRTDRVIERSGIPVLIFHGRQDDVIPVWHGRRLRDLAGDRGRYFELDYGHDSLFARGYGDLYWREIARFLAEHGVAP